MNNVSMAWTDKAFRAGRKTETRRNWSAEYAARFHEGDHVCAYNKLPRAGGVQVGYFTLAQDPYLESTESIPDSAWEAEGFAFMEEIGETIDGMTPAEFWYKWKTEPVELWVLKFENVKVWSAHRYVTQ